VGRRMVGRSRRRRTADRAPANRRGIDPMKLPPEPRPLGPSSWRTRKHSDLLDRRPERTYPRGRRSRPGYFGDQSRTVARAERLKRRDLATSKLGRTRRRVRDYGCAARRLFAWFRLSRPNRTRDDSCAATYYPGTANRDEAVPISVGFTTLHDGFQLVLACQR